ncbi:hypothetical protein M0811_04704 [Anaeramoeba ignava]|uniref:Uncharacterized protein n=1 Tax=Anaeramoeba ignava TaxID=1746090 RepID=A0A9Q0LSD7_ANAIG|nr:hypothetical protein M0811_04704 [Anaeramoeba ignava]
MQIIRFEPSFEWDFPSYDYSTDPSQTEYFDSSLPIPDENVFAYKSSSNNSDSQSFWDNSVKKNDYDSNCDCCDCCNCGGIGDCQNCDCGNGCDSCNSCGNDCGGCCEIHNTPGCTIN